MKNPFKKRSTKSVFVLQDSDISLPYGYTSLERSPEVQQAVNVIAGLISSMTIYLMRNTKDGDVRERNELSKKVDVYPYKYMTRHNWMFYIVKNMITKGNQIVLPILSGGKIENLKPLRPSEISFIKDDDDYLVQWRGKTFEPNELLHFSVNPNVSEPYKGAGLTVNLGEVIRSLAQAQQTKTEFMSSKWKPSLIIRVHGISEQFKSKDGRDKMLSDFFETNEAGKPWIIPAQQFEVSQVKPLSLNDLAINDGVTMDKRAVAAMIGVPAFLLGVGDFKQDEYNNFIQTRVMQIAQIIQQELTAKLLYSPDRYFMFNYRSLYNYTLSEKVTMYSQMADRLAIDRNEFRDAMGLEPREDMKELLGLENYIPAAMLGQQKKLKQEETDE